MGYAYIDGGGGAGGVDVTNATATADRVLSGKTFATAESAETGELVTGTMPNKTTTHTLTLNEKWTIPKGYHDGTKAVTQNLTYIGAQNGTLAVNGSASIKAGYHNGSGKYTQSLTTVAGGTYNPGTSDRTLSTKNKYLTSDIIVPASNTLLASNIVKGKSILGINGSFVNQAASHTAYNGSSFSGVMSGGVKLDAEFIYKRTKDASLVVRITPSDFTLSNGVLSGTVRRYGKHETAPTSRTSQLGFVTAKSVKLDLYSTIVVKFTASRSNTAQIISPPFAWIMPISTEKVSDSDNRWLAYESYVRATDQGGEVWGENTRTFDVSELSGWHFLMFYFDSTGISSNNNLYSDLTVVVNSITFNS